MTTLQKWLEAFGWLGIAAILLAFWLTTTGKILPASSVTLWLNLFGGVSIALASYTKRAYQLVVINVIWALVAAYGLLKVFLK